MARIIYGPIITDIKGSIGGITFQKNGSGTIARLKPRKVMTNTQKQRDQQPRLKQLQREWNLLSLANKILWNDFAAVNNKIGLDGQEKKLTGYQWFLSINENLVLINEDTLQAPPVYEVVNPINNVTMYYDLTTFGLLPNVNFDLDNYAVMPYCSFIVNSVSKFDFNNPRWMNEAVILTSVLYWWGTGVLTKNWSEYFKTDFPPNLGGKSFYIMAYIRIISKASGISSLAYTAIERFVWDGAEYVIE